MQTFEWPPLWRLKVPHRRQTSTGYFDSGVVPMERHPWGAQKCGGCQKDCRTDAESEHTSESRSRRTRKSFCDIELDCANLVCPSLSSKAVLGMIERATGKKSLMSHSCVHTAICCAGISRDRIWVCTRPKLGYPACEKAFLKYSRDFTVILVHRQMQRGGRKEQGRERGCI